MSSSRQQKYSDGSMYVGEWNSDSQKHGRGKLMYSNKTEYIGQFEHGLHSGSGVLLIPDTSNKSLSHKYEGDFKNGCFDGFGVFTRSDGMKYEGEFKDGNITGFGLVTFSDGGHGLPRQEGKFDCGKLIESCECSSQVKKAQDAAATARNVA